METWFTVCPQNLTDYNERHDHKEVARSDYKSCLYCKKDNTLISFFKAN